MISRTHRDGSKELRVLVLGIHSFGEEMVQRFKESDRYKILRLRIALRIDDRVTETELKILARDERKHIRRHEFIMRTIVKFGAVFGVSLYVIIRRINHIAG